VVVDIVVVVQCLVPVVVVQCLGLVVVVQCLWGKTQVSLLSLWVVVVQCLRLLLLEAQVILIRDLVVVVLYFKWVEPVVGRWLWDKEVWAVVQLLWVQLLLLLDLPAILIRGLVVGRWLLVLRRQTQPRVLGLWVDNSQVDLLKSR
jgi:hypothetical protein